VTIEERLRQLVAALPSQESSVTFTREDLVVLLEEHPGESSAGLTRDLTVQEGRPESQASCGASANGDERADGLFWLLLCPQSQRRV
jgi:hypothetical protein